MTITLQIIITMLCFCSKKFKRSRALVLSQFLLANTSSPALENNLSAGTEVPGMQWYFIATYYSRLAEWHMRMSHEGLLQINTNSKYDTSSSDASVGNIDILISVSPIAKSRTNFQLSMYWMAYDLWLNEIG